MNYTNAIKCILVAMSVIGISYSEELIKEKMPTRIISDSQKYLLKIDKSKIRDTYYYEFNVIQEDKNNKFQIELPYSCNVFFITDRAIIFTNNFDDSIKSRPLFTIDLDKLEIHEIEASQIIEDYNLSSYTTNSLGYGVNRYEDWRSYYLRGIKIIIKATRIAVLYFAAS